MLRLSPIICSRILSSSNFISKNVPIRRNIHGLLSKHSPFKGHKFVQSQFRQTTTISIENSTLGTVSERIVGYWLLGCGTMVFGAVLLGGITRLTKSGLSMVTWKLLGEKMPGNLQEWEEEFERYKQYPEFKINNKNITLEEFKWIWQMEYGHRMWGRAIGAVFLIPACYFWARGYFNTSMKKRVVAYGTLIAAQGLLGWYMVKSGLEDRFQAADAVPRVSQYRLAAHLATAFGLYSLLLWGALSHLVPAQKLDRIPNAAQRRIRWLSHTSKGLIFLTAVSGAFVAGLEAGLVYNSFPKMADRWIPEDILAHSPKIKNFFENPTTVQFDHRILGISTLATILMTYMLSRRIPLPPRATTAVKTLAILGCFQVALGITTLLTFVPTSLAIAHQSGSLLVLSTAIWLTHELKFLKRIPK